MGLIIEYKQGLRDMMRRNYRRKRLFTGIASLFFFIGASFCFGSALQGCEFNNFLGIELNENAVYILNYLPFFNAKADGSKPYPYGNVQNQLILVNLKGAQDTGTWLNEEKLNRANAAFNEGNESLKQYIADISANTLIVSSYFYGAQGKDGYVPSQSKEYYLTATDNKSESELEQELLREILDQFETDGALLNRTCAELDTNADGFLDNVTFVIRGDKDNAHNLIWPHQYALNPTGIKGNYPEVTCADGTLKVKDYNVVLGGDGFTHSAGIFNEHQNDLGVVAHEFMHIYGYPDLYHNYKYDPKTNEFVSLTMSERKGDPLGRWEVMDYTVGNKPQYPMYYTNLTYAPWKDALAEPQVITGSQKVTLQKVDYRNGGSSQMAAIIKVDQSLNPLAQDEYFMVEYRKQERWDTGIPQSGLLVYRINTAANTKTDIAKINDYCTAVNGGKQTYCGNMFGPPDEVYLFRPNAKEINPSSFGSNSDLNLNQAALSLSLGKDTLGKSLDEVSSYHPNTLASTIYYSDGTNSGIVISNVSDNTKDTITFDITMPISEVDTDAPVMDKIEGVGFDGNWTNKAPVISIHVMDQGKGLDTIEVTTKDGTIVESNGKSYTKKYDTNKNVKDTTFTFTAKNKGTYHITAIDQAGNKSETKTVVIENIDTTLPVIQADEKAIVTADTKQIKVTFTDDASGIDESTKAYTTISMKEDTSNLSYPNAIEGDTITVPKDFQGKVCISVKDYAGNKSKSPACWVLSDDKDAPTISSKLDENNEEWTSKNRKITVQAHDGKTTDTGISYFEITTKDGLLVNNNEKRLVKDFKENGANQETFAFEVKSNGTYDIKACDYANHCVDDSVNVTNIDQTAPVIDAIHISNERMYGLFTTSAHNISFDAHDEPQGNNSGLREIKYQIVENGGSYEKDSTSPRWMRIDADEDIETEEGFTGMIYAYAVDNAGNISKIVQKEINRISNDLVNQANVITDASGKVSILGIKDSDVSILLKETSVDMVKSQVSEEFLYSYELQEVFDFDLQKDQATYDLNERVTVRLHVRQMDDTIKLVAIDESGNHEVIDALNKDGYMEFETDEIKLFVAVKEKVPSSGVIQESTPNTGDADVMMYYVIAVILSIAGLSCFVHFRRYNES